MGAGVEVHPQGAAPAHPQAHQAAAGWPGAGVEGAVGHAARDPGPAHLHRDGTRLGLAPEGAVGLRLERGLVHVRGPQPASASAGSACARSRPCPSAPGARPRGPGLLPGHAGRDHDGQRQRRGPGAVCPGADDEGGGPGRGLAPDPERRPPGVPPVPGGGR